MNDGEAICLSKERFDNESIAYAVAREYLMAQGVKNDVYLCRIWEGYHLTSARDRRYDRAIKRNIRESRQSKFEYYSTKHHQEKE